MPRSEAGLLLPEKDIAPKVAGPTLEQRLLATEATLSDTIGCVERMAQQLVVLGQQVASMAAKADADAAYMANWPDDALVVELDSVPSGGVCCGGACKADEPDPAPPLPTRTRWLGEKD